MLIFTQTLVAALSKKPTHKKTAPGNRQCESVNGEVKHLLSPVLRFLFALLFLFKYFKAF